jgi:hypothetical protein
VQRGIGSISLNPDAIGLLTMAAAEQQEPERPESSRRLVTNVP